MAETTDKPKSPKASESQVKTALSQLDEINEHANDNSDDYSRWALEFLGQAIDRAEQFGEKAYFSTAQTEIISKMYKEKILGEEQSTTPVKSTRFAHLKAKGEK